MCQRRPKEGARDLGDEVTGSTELPSVGAEKVTRVPWESMECS